MISSSSIHAMETCRFFHFKMKGKCSFFNKKTVSSILLHNCCGSEDPTPLRPALYCTHPGPWRSSINPCHQELLMQSEGFLLRNSPSHYLSKEAHCLFFISPFYDFLFSFFEWVSMLKVGRSSTKQYLWIQRVTK